MHRGEPRQQAPAPQQREAAAAAVQPQAGIGDAEPCERLQRLLGQIVDAAVERTDEKAAELAGKETPEPHQRTALQKRAEAVVAQLRSDTTRLGKTVVRTCKSRRVQLQ